MSRTASTENTFSYDITLANILENDDREQFSNLVEEEPSILHKNFYNISISMYVCMSGKYNILQYLIENNLFSPEENILSLTAEIYINNNEIEEKERVNHINVIKLLFENGYYFDSNMNYDWGFIYIEGEERILNIDLEKHIADLVLYKRIHLNHTDKNGHNPFLEACFYSGPDLLEAMLKNGAMLEQPQNPSNLSPLVMAITGEKFYNVVYLLQQYGNRESIKNETNDLLAIAALKNNLDILLYLMKFGFSVLESDALSISVNKGLYHIAETLILHGGQPNLLSSTGYLPLDFAIRAKRYDMIKLLIKYGADIYKNNKYDVSPFQHAIETKNSGFFNIIESNIQNNESVNEIDKYIFIESVAI